MNKKFTTLLASAMLATAFSAGAAVDAKKGDAVLLKTGSSYLSAQTGENFGKLALGTSVDQLADLNKATWTVTEKKTSLGKTIYSFVNKATGLMLAVDPTLAVDKSKTEGTALTLGGSATEWVEENDALVSYFKGDSVLFIKKDAQDVLFLAKGKVADVTTDKFALNTSDFKEDMQLSAEDLNTLLQSTAENGFQLNMTPEVTKGQTNLLTATSLKAVAIEGEKYVRLQAKDKKVDDKQAYVVVDTAYYGGTESGKLLKYTYDHNEYAADKVKREAGSYKFYFTYNAKKNELYAQVAKVVHQFVKGTKTDDQWKTFLESNNNSTWTVDGTTETQEFGTDEYIYMAKLAGTNVLTVNVDGDTRTSGAVAVGNQNVKITIGTNFVGLKPATIADGVYTVMYKAKKGNDNFDKNGSYALANLAGDFGWADQAKRQDFNHMPAAQWVVKKQGTSATAPVAIVNREFSELDASTCLPKTATQFYAVEGSDDVFYFNTTGVKDTLSFVKVADALVKDVKLGYKYVSENEAKVQTYTFNYLHGLSADKYLFTPAGRNDVVYVDANGEKSNFRLELVVKDDKYGYEDGLVRNVYYVTDGKGNYLSYDENAKKYKMLKATATNDVKTPFFLKENNCDEGKAYYALVEADLEIAFDKDDNKFFNVKDHSEVKAYDANKAEKTYQSASKDYATVKVSVDDNTLDLTEGNLKDKFINGDQNEIRTSAFAVEFDNTPLYRRFNNAALGENANDAVDSLLFKESVRGEYLMDEWNKKLQDNNVNYAGIWNKDKAEGKLALIVDTAWVERGLGTIKPQYLISVAREDQEGTPGVPCTYEHNHFDNEGNAVDAAHCSHATKGHAGFRYGKYLVNFSDSAKAAIDAEAAVNPYLFNTNAATNSSYTRVGFVKAVQAGDSLFILTNGLENKKPSELNVEDIIANYTKAKINTKYIVNLKGDKHKNVTWSFRYINPDKASAVTEEGADNSFLFESNVYGEKDKATDTQYQTVYGDADKAIAPTEKAAWLKMHNGCLVLTDKNAKFDASKTGGDGALVFNAYQKEVADDMVTSNDKIATEGVSVIAGNGVVTVQGAAGKSVVITNILGKVIAETVLTSDNATISVPAGIVAVAVDGEEAVKAIVK